MPRMLANEFIYSSSTADERYNEYVTPTSPLYHQQTQSMPQQHLHHNHNQSNVALTASTSLEEQRNLKSRSSHSPTQQFTQSSDSGQNTSPEMLQQQQQQRIHFISASDAGEEAIPIITDKPITTQIVASVSSDDIEDFEGFDEDIEAENNAIFQTQYQDDGEFHGRGLLKRHSQADYQEYHEDSEGVVEAIEVDDDEDIEEVDGQCLFRLRREKTPVNTLNRYAVDCNPHTPNKRKKCQNEGEAVTPPNLRTPPDQIVEINSDSTTISQKQKRQQINTKFQLNLSQKHTHKANNANVMAANKCSTESTSEFPVSSPSNPQQPRGGGGGGKYPPRPPLLKNTLPADSFERQLAMITACNPQMTLAEKIQSWCFEDELSDVEDVIRFDADFKRLEEQKKSELTKQKNKKSNVGEKQYDFAIFRQMIINNMNLAQQSKRFNTGGSSGCGPGGFSSSASCMKGHEDTSASSSGTSKSAKHLDERPSTSAVAQQQLQQRRCKPTNTNLETGEMIKKQRFVKEINNKRNQNSTSPPATSSSENDRDCFQNSKKISGTHKRFPTGVGGGGGGGGVGVGGGGKILVHEKLLCPSSSEEANSQDVPTHMHLAPAASLAINNLFNKAPSKITSKGENVKDSKNPNCLAVNEENDSVFRLHRLNREIDKPGILASVVGNEHVQTPAEISEEETATAGVLIQMRMGGGGGILKEDWSNSSLENSKKNQNLFKTPTVPPKYFPQTTSESSPTQICSSPPINHKNLASRIGEGNDAKTVNIESQLITAVPTSFDPIMTVAPSIKLENGKLDEAEDAGVYHQQHEFCNYLGLTGMSTATAMANAISELAQSNPARRSMRVLRQQQQERKERSAKEEREMRAMKDRQHLKELKNRDQRVEAAEDQMHLLDEGTNSQTSEPTHSTTNSLNDIKKKTSITSITTKSSPNSQPSSSSVGTEKNEPHIKILCHIETTSAINDDIKVETTDNNLSPKIATKIIPMRENLIRQAKQKKLPTTEETPKILAEIKSESFSKDDFLAEPERHLLSPQEPFVIPDRRKKILRSPRLTNLKNNLEITPSKMRTILADNDQLLLKSSNGTKREEGEKVQTTPTHFKVEPLTGDSATIATFKSSPQKSELASRLSVSQENIAKTAEKDYHSCDEVLSVDRSLSPTSAMIKQKLQAALEESRKTKPSIFIIQSLESNKEKLCRTKSVSSIETKYTPTTTPVPETLAPITSSKLSTKLSEFTSRIAKTVKKENNSKRRVKMRKTKMFSLRSTPKRELRTRKIILLKSNKKRTTAIGKKTKKEAKSIVQFPRKSTPTKPALNSSAAKSKDVLNKVNIEVQPAPLYQIKSYRNAQTETNDLDMYNKQSRNRLMAKATALIQRSRRRMSLCRAGGSGGKDLRSKLLQKNTINTAPNVKVLPNLQPKIRLVRAKIEESLKDEGKACSSTASTMPSPSTQQPAVVSMTTTTTNRTDLVLKEDREALNIKITNLASSSCILQDNENVVVSSTTNSYDERPIHGGNAPRMPSSPITLRSVHSSASCVVASTPVETKDNWTQSDNQHFATAGFGIQYLNDLPSAVQVMRNPIKREYGLVEYIYYEVDILIVVQERLISFWKSSRLLNALTAAPTKIHTQQQTKQNNIITTKPPSTPPPPMQDSNNSWFGLPSSSSSSPPTAQQSKGEWILLGELKRLTYDFEVTTAYANRICLHNSTPIYVEMRAHPLPNNNRECNLLSMYINIYYYHDEDMIAKTNSIQLDTIQSEIHLVTYTTLVDSRYFIMTWPQENLLGKTRSGLCKYSLTPQLDTLASIREFKSMRHAIRYLECMGDDKLLGFGDSQLTIWDHRSGDILMNYDLDIPIGRHLGSVYYPNQEIEQSNMIILFQYRDLTTDKPDEPPELLTIACTMAHTQPSYRIIQKQQLPFEFKRIKRAINTGEHLIITNLNDEEIWISCNNPALVALVSQQQQHPHLHKQRFFCRQRSQLIELTEETLNFDTLANHILQLAAAAGLALNNI